MVIDPMLSRVRGSLSVRARSYVRVVIALGFNVPFIIAALSRYPGGSSWSGLGGAYAGLVFLGYYVLILLTLLTVLFVVTGAWPRLFERASAVLLALALYYLVVDAVVYRVVRMHIDAFWLQYLFTTFDGIGIGGLELAGGIALLVLIGGLEWWIFRSAGRVQPRTRWAVGLAATSVLAFIASQAVHIAAYETNDTRITAITPELPFYYPITSHRNAVRYGGHLSMIREVDGGADDGAPRSLRYPLREVTCTVPTDRPRPNILVLLLESWRADALDPVVSPRMHAFSGRASVFLQHFSTGNSTPAGVFPLFYGIHPTYWTAVKANNPYIDNPVLIDVLKANGYAFGIYADSHFERHKIKETVFRGIEVHESFRGETVDARDGDMTDRLLAFMQARHREGGTPFFGFGYYKSTHYPYDYPPASAPFRPSSELNVFLADAEDDPTPVLNDYRNAVHYVDGLIGGLLQRMEAGGLLENTIVVITGDHGEEFNDNGSNYWGHTGNFTRFQTHVPLIVYVPGRPPRRVEEVTSEVDIPPTLLQEGLACGVEEEDYSNGVNLFGPLEASRPVVVASYVNHALIVGDAVFVIWPLYVQRHKLDDIRASADWPAADVIARALEGMARFYGT